MRLDKDGIMIVMGSVNARVDSDNNLLEHLMTKHDFDGRDSNDERFVDFPSFNRISIGGT